MRNHLRLFLKLLMSLRITPSSRSSVTSFIKHPLTDDWKLKEFHVFMLPFKQQQQQQLFSLQSMEQCIRQNNAVDIYEVQISSSYFSWRLFQKIDRFNEWNNIFGWPKWSSFLVQLPFKFWTGRRTTSRRWMRRRSAKNRKQKPYTCSGTRPEPDTGDR